VEEKQIMNRKETILNRRAIVLLSVIVGLFAVLISVIIISSKNIVTSIKSERHWNAKQTREYANKLKADGLVGHAAEAFEEYVSKADPDNKTRSNIYYSIGEMYFNNKRYEDALSYFYKAEIANKNTHMKKEIGTYIVSCLERLGKSLDAQYQLETRSVLGSEEKQKKASGEKVGSIGKRDITMGEINSAIEKLPEWIKKQYSADESQKLEFLKQYIATELLYDKGIKLGYEREPDIREQIEDVSKQVVVQKVISEEVGSKLKVDPDDIKNYYEANKENYKDKDGNEQDFESVKEQVASDYGRQKSDTLVQKLMQDMLKVKDVKIYESKFKSKKAK
jgi:tetratricopeptide (TPR) repeat protein